MIITMHQWPLFDSSNHIPARNREWFLSISYDQDEILRSISILHNDGRPFECDPTYSRGVFYRNFPEPRLKFDLAPQSPEVQQADCRALPLASGSVESIMFDPPFVMSGDAHKVEATGKIALRFTAFSTFAELTDLYVPAIQEFYRILKPSGLLVFKCQDSVGRQRQHLTHVDVVGWAQDVGFYAKDMFVLVNTNVLMDPRWENQQHARKAHSYFLVFVKQAKNALRVERCCSTTMAHAALDAPAPLAKA